jgi:L,D-peptidoglycan transpeptidase YkuD (ErfK/YbiS/YcfS/YnhG family)
MNVAAQHPAITNSLQAVVVTTANAASIGGTARLYERKTAASRWISVGAEFPVVVGKNGMTYSEMMPEKVSMIDLPPKYKREGDGTSPAGIFDLTSAFGRADRPDFVKLPYTRLEEGTECIDDSNSSGYNTIVNRTRIAAVDWKSSEKMLSVGPQYDLGVFVAYNTPATAQAGSCIFLHVWKNAAAGTAGCTAMEHSNIEKVLAWLDVKKRPVLVQMPIDVYKTYQATWKLPLPN